jgi:hypothetical protein
MKAIHNRNVYRRYFWFTWLIALRELMEATGSEAYWVWLNAQDNLTLPIPDHDD